MKILLSTCLLHTRKSIWRVVSSMVGYLFFGSDRLFTKKERSSQSWLEEFSKVWFYTFSGLRDSIIQKMTPFGIFFRNRSDSLNMNDTEFSFIGFIKLNIERPILGKNPSSLRFIKHMSLDLSFDKLYWVFVTLFELVKPKRGTHRSWWGKWEGNNFANNGSCFSLPLYMALVCTIMSVNCVFS